MRVTPKKTSKITNIITKHIKDNIRIYIIISLFLLIGIILGVVLVNNITETQMLEIKNYLTDFINSLKNGEKINNTEILKNSFINNLLLVFIMWFVGSTVIGIPIVIGIVVIRGLTFGYTISSVLISFSLTKSLIFISTSMLLHNLLFFPCLTALAVSGVKLYKSIMKDKRKENIKLEIIRHTAFSFVILIILTITSFVETYISNNLLLLCIQYI